MCHGTTLLRFIKQIEIMFSYAFFLCVCKLLAKLVAGMFIVSRMGMKGNKRISFVITLIY